MSTLKNKIISRIIELEGGYVNNPSDSGGETNFGITEKVARKNGYAGPMVAMPYQVAFDIYCRRYWDVLRLDDVEDISVAIAAEVADTAVNMGPRRAALFLQRSLNVLNRKGYDYTDLVVDGVVGDATIGALRSFYHRRGSKGVIVLETMLNCLQGAFYVELAERREKDEEFIYGWFSHRVGLA